MALALPDRLSGQSGGWLTQDSLNIGDLGLPFPASFLSLSSYDSLHCVATGFAPSTSAVYVTVNGGHSWRTTLIDSGFVRGRQFPIKFRASAWPAPGVCIVVGDSGVVLRSSDSGATWRQIACDASVPEGLVMPLQSISMCDSLHGVIVGATRVLLTTDDAGLSWQRVHLPALDSIPGLAIGDVACLSPSTFILPAQGFIHDTNIFHLYRTEDAGVTWSTIDVDTVQRMAFVDSLHGWAVGSGYSGNGRATVENIIRTDDGGRTWTQLVHNSVQTYGFLSVAFADVDHGMVTAQDGRILRTQNGGETWERSERSDGGSLDGNHHATCVAYPTAGKAWAGTIRGQILQFDAGRVSGVGAHAEDGNGIALSAMPTVARSRLDLVYSVPQTGRCAIDVVDLRGSIVFRIEDRLVEAGSNSAHVDLSDVSAGTYLVRLRCPTGTAVQRIVVVR